MADFEFDVDGFLRGLDFTSEAVRRSAEEGMEDVVNDLSRTSAETAPIDEGELRQSVHNRVSWQGNTVIGEVLFSAPHAIYMHEMTYNLGPQSSLAPGGTGMSGTLYNVGNKYLERPLMGESDAYKRYIAEKIREGLA